MTEDHPLDRPVWNALTSRWRGLAEGDENALRLSPDYGPFAAMADDGAQAQAALAALIPAGGAVAMIEARTPTPPPGARVAQSGVLYQMVATAMAAPDPGFDIAPLTDADGPDLLALATLTEPGPFAARTHQLGGFIGVKRDGRLAAMTGERMRLPGFTEVSAVCTHPDHRGNGYAAALTARVSARILDRGETPFLHVFTHNTGAIAVYRKLGFTIRREMSVTVLTRARAAA